MNVSGAKKVISNSNNLYLGAFVSEGDRNKHSILELLICNEFQFELND